MTLLHTHRGEPLGSRGLRDGSRLSVARARRKIVAALKAMHCAIVAAKLRRLRNELMFHRGMDSDLNSQGEIDITRIPRRPLILGDKWDF